SYQIIRDARPVVKSRIAEKCDFPQVFEGEGCRKAKKRASEAPGGFRRPDLRGLGGLIEVELGGTGFLRSNLRAIRCNKAELLAQFAVQPLPHVGIGRQERASVFAALADPLAAKAEPGAALFHESLEHSKVQQIALTGHAFAIENVYF